MSAPSPALRAAALSSPAAMAAVLTRGQGQPYLDAPHLRLVDDAFRDVVSGRQRKVGIFMPPRHGKSLRLRWCLLWFLATHPDERIMIACYSQPLADGHGRWIRNMIRDHGLDGTGLLPIRLDPSSQAANRLDLDGRDGGMFATSVGGSGTGMGARVLLVDDPVKDRQEAESKVIMDATEDWWTDVATTRLTPDGGIVLMHTRWSEQDLAGRLLAKDADSWKVVEAPAIAMTADEYRALDREPLPDPLGRTPGEALWPDVWGTDVLANRRRDVGEAAWWSLYQQSPRRPEGSLLSRADVEGATVAADALPDDVRAAVAVDPSGGGRDTAGVVGGLLGTDERVYVTHDRSDRMSSTAWSEAACLLAYELGADTIVYEANFGGDMVQRSITTAWDDLDRRGEVDGLCPRVVPVHARKGKFLRAEPVAQLFKTGRARFGPGLSAVTHEWTTWAPDSGFSPGRIDASVYLALHLAPVGRSKMHAPREGWGKRIEGGPGFGRRI
ncbi:terminase, large subunit [Streptomyces europaeiscabiei]|jgi:hypothetical protein|uniref:terminase, large subunit n=1 Tax=Streptomyces europaeiscabiei TaxID=146819 RepID=UPI0029A89139|nr:terminase, large subunit [Streptomyces europaeiscabiei]MDX3860053.1 terminase, large subunit [Streptomyces europaeiscabiei]